MTEHIEGSVNAMCNLSEAILEQGIEQGRIQEHKQAALRMIADGDLPLKKIALYSGLSLEQVMELKKNYHS